MSRQPITNGELEALLETFKTQNEHPTAYLLCELSMYSDDEDKALVYGLTYYIREADQWHSPAAGRFWALIKRIDF